MSTRMQTVVASVIVLALGILVGWHASRMPMDANATGANTEIGDDRADLSPRLSYESAPARRSAGRGVFSRGVTVPAGTPVDVTVHRTLSTKTVSTGDAWSGEVAEPVYANGRVVIPAGSTVRGTVVTSRAPQRGTRAALQLALSSIVIDGRSHTVRGTAPAVVAGSPRTRNVGAIAGGTAAGAILGKAIGGDTKDAVIGGVIGGAAAGGAVAASKGYQATIPAGRELTFTTTRSVSVRA